jgi:phosphoglycerol transferase MdoB-like AlkP superfamily enzyme
MDTSLRKVQGWFLIALFGLMLVFSFILDPFFRHAILILFFSVFFLGFAKVLYRKRYDCLYFSGEVFGLFKLPKEKPEWFPCIDNKVVSMACLGLGFIFLLYFFYWNIWVVPILG